MHTPVIVHYLNPKLKCNISLNIITESSANSLWYELYSQILVDTFHRTTHPGVISFKHLVGCLSVLFSLVNLSA